MIRIALLGLAIAVAVPSGVSAQTIMGAGMISCGEWTRLRSFEGRAGNFKELASLYQAQAWVDGFVSGINSANNVHTDLLASRPSGVAMYAWVDNYCRSKPLDVVAQAVDALVKELESRAVR
jgi:hypothetical protein